MSVRLALMLALCMGGAGCTSIYSRTQRQLPPDPAAELNLRVTEARQAGKLCDKAVARLLDSLQHRGSGAVIQVDFDRLETTAFDLERRVLAAADAAARCGKAGQFEDELGKLGRRAQTWLEYVHANRAADSRQQLQNLRVLTPSS